MAHGTFHSVESFERSGLWRRRRLAFDLLDGLIQTGPTGCTGSPDVLLRRDRGRVIQSADPDDPQVRPRRSVAINMAATGRAKETGDGVAAVGLFGVLGQWTLHMESIGVEHSIDRAIGRYVLAIAAPAHTRSDGFFGQFESDSAAQTASSSIGHGMAPEASDPMGSVM